MKKQSGFFEKATKDCSKRKWLPFDEDKDKSETLSIDKKQFGARKLHINNKPRITIKNT